MLSVPDQSAGQLLKCPLCSTTFAAPGLPQTPPSAPPEPAASSSASSDVYSLSPEMNPPRTEPPPLKEADRPIREPAVSFSPAPPAGYGHTFTVWLSPRVLPWVAAGSVVLVFVLSFFPWIGIYVLGTPLYTQNAWQAAFNGPEEKDQLAPALAGTQISLDKSAPGVNSLLIIYVVFLFFTVVLTVAAAAVPFLPPKNLPPSIQPLLPWRWKAAGALLTFTFLFLVFQLLIGFSLEHRMDAEKDKGLSAAIIASLVHRTGWLTWTVILHFIAVAAGALVVQLEQRGARPLPRFEVHW
jgi:hypothetical protein